MQRERSSVFPGIPSFDSGNQFQGAINARRKGQAMRCRLD